MYQQEEVCDLSLKIIDKLNLNEIRCTVLTKGIFPREIAKMNGFSRNNEYGVTLVSLDETFRKSYEPNAAPFKNRVQSLKYLHDKGYKTWVSMEPYPTPNFIEQDLKEILDAVSFVDKIIFGRINYNAKVSEFKNAKEFYSSLACSVINFCKKNRIDYHIKSGTQAK